MKNRKSSENRNTGSKTAHHNFFRLPIYDLWGSANYTMGLSGTVWSLHMGAGLYGLGRALRYTRSKQTKKNLGKSNFLVGGLAHGREIFRVDTAFVAAHFPSRIVWGPNPITELFRKNGAETTPTSKCKCIDVLAHINNRLQQPTTRCH